MSQTKEGVFMRTLKQLVLIMTFVLFSLSGACGQEHLQTDTEVAGEAGTVEWRADLTDVPIPEMPLQGVIHGQEFRCERAYIRGPILHLRQGQEHIPDRSLKIFLFVETDEIENNTIEVNKEGSFGDPHIHMSSRQKGETFPQIDMFFDDYVMRLEFGTSSEGRLPGRIYICLPDEQQSVAAGDFIAEIE